MTVTERDAKALGQPVGSTTTVLLTAYPGGHSGAVGGEASTAAQPVTDQLLTTQQQNSASTNVQVVYSASHMDSISDSVGTSIPSSIPQTETFSSTLATGGVAEVSGVSATMGSVLSTVNSTTPIPSIGDVVGSEYLNPTAGQDVMMGGATDAGTNEGATPADLAAQLISQYTSGDGDSGSGAPFDMKVPMSKPDEPPTLLPSSSSEVPSTSET